MSYYSIEEIETECIRVPTRFRAQAPNLGFLMATNNPQSSVSKDIHAGAEVILPLWLATPLAAESLSEDGEQPLLELLEPSALRSDVLNVLKSEPLALNLRDQNRLFTNLALRWCELFSSEELSKILADMVRIRASHIFDSALAQQGDDTVMDDYEQRMYVKAAQTIRDLRQWQQQN